MVVRISYAAAAAGLNAIIALCGGTAYVECYTGAMPTNAEDAATGTKLWSLAMSATAFAAAADQNPDARATANAITAANALATGTGGYARVCSSAGGTCIAQGDIGVTGEVGAFLALFNSLEFVSGVQASVTALYLTLPEVYDV